ncbi:hypothetical protein [Streptomyces diastatochromogenes]|uniref:Uncharacterized protein n=1 Tax=Streptomyces diastatochromogenes TaxID=42236 RepID=A0A233SIV8_STRDA|nr:hypothetical protein [Streptomyces diastatochromogenes]MCZ0988592.1 hypothetical protein [Streptomyces diastatochromogenes]OXY95581.1 hypothetical protein BEK98_15665 [Streptomyces diastatochromogenes]
MNERISSPWLPTWIPDRGHALRHAGIHFDAVRIGGPLGERVASELILGTDFEAGPIVREFKGDRNMYFLLPPQTAASYRWPPVVQTLTRGNGWQAYVGVPALTGDTWPLDWRSTPTEGVPFVAGELLHEVVSQMAGATR